MKRSVLATVAFATVFALALSACGKGQQPSQATSTNSASRLVPEIVFFLPASNYIQTQYDAGALVAKAWEQLGLKVKLVTHPDWATFVGMIGDRSKWDVSEQSFVANPSRLDPDEMLTRMFLCKYGAQGGTNYGGFCDPAFDKLAAAQRAEMDLSKRQQLVFDTQRLLLKDLPGIALFHDKTISVYNKQKFGNVVEVPGVGLMNIFNFTRATPLAGDNTLVTSYVGQVRSVNPLNAPSWDVEQEFQRLVYDTLTRAGTDGKVQPWAAESWQVVNPTTVTVTLRQGMKFHDGQPVTAADVAFSYNFIKQNKIGAYQVALDSIEAVTAKDPRTVEFKLTAPYAPLYLSTFGQVPILPEHIWSQHQQKPADWDNAQMIGSGPFKFQSFAPGQELVLLKNSDHFAAPKVDKLVLRPFSSAESRFLAMQKGDVQFHESKGLPPSQNIEAKKNPLFGMIESPGSDVRWLDFNVSRPPFQDYAFRLALVQAIDYKTIVTDVLKGQGDPGQGFVPPGNTYWHDASLQPVSDDSKPHYYQFDLSKAKAALKQAGYEWDASGRLLYPKDYKPALLPSQ